MSNCKDCIFWERVFVKNFKVLDETHPMFGHETTDWHFTDIPYTEIEPTIANYGKCNKLTKENFKPADAAMLFDDVTESEEIFTNENFGCILFKSKP